MSLINTVQSYESKTKYSSNAKENEIIDIVFGGGIVLRARDDTRAGGTD